MDSKSNKQFISLDRAVTTKLACTECRSKHVKCDGTTPVCGRCRDQDRECTYLQSRRGCRSYHTIDKRKASLRPSRKPSMSVSPAPPQARTVFESIKDYGTQADNVYNLSTVVKSFKSQPLDPLPKYLNLFYSNFHPAHPFILPPRYASTLLHRSRHTRLAPAMEYIGSLYATMVDDSARIAPPPLMPLLMNVRDGWTVQALLLMAIATHCMGDTSSAAEIFKQAVDVALDIGMNRSTFAAANGQNIPILEESWNRTWWELYCMDVMFAAINKRTTYFLKDVVIDVSLPCEEDLYFSKDYNASSSLYISDLENRFFDMHDKGFSSFAHRIAAIQVLAKVLDASADSPVDYSNAYDLADSSVRNLSLHLPSDKSELVDSQGRVDEMLFQTHMILHASTIYLHRPRSRLPLPMATVVAQCVPEESDRSMPYRSVQYHTAQTTKAAESMSALVQLPCSITTHTPFFACGLALTTFVQLAQLEGYIGRKETIRERLRLNVGALKLLGKVWSLVGTIRDQVLAAITHVDYSVQSQKQTKELIENMESGNLLDFSFESLWFDT